MIYSEINFKKLLFPFQPSVAFPKKLVEYFLEKTL